MAAKTQLAKIHIAKKQLKLTDEEYRAILSAYNVTSSKYLSFSDAESLINKFIELGFKPRPPKTTQKNKYEELRDRAKNYATPGQLRMIEGLWQEVSRSKNAASLNKFIKRITGKSHITFMEKTDVSKVKLALLKMRRKK